MIHYEFDVARILVKRNLSPDVTYPKYLERKEKYSPPSDLSFNSSLLLDNGKNVVIKFSTRGNSKI